jgi:hypothetical protein
MLGFEFAPGRREALEALAADSLARASAMESAAEPPFSAFLADFINRGIPSAARQSVEICD